MQESSSPDQLPSLSTTSPINNTTSTENAFPPLSDKYPRLRKHHKFDAQTRQRRVAATQSAKREVLANVREDWTWPPSADRSAERFVRRRNSTEWHERESDSSPLASRSPSPTCPDPYRFESPDSIAPPFVSARSKRRRLLDDELGWNEGLRVFSERRDSWTGAEVRSPVPDSKKTLLSGSMPNQEETMMATDEEHPNDHHNEFTILNIHTTDVCSSISTSSHSPNASTFSRPSFPPSIQTSPSSAPQDTSTSHPSSPTASPTCELRTLVPIAPPLLSPTSHPDLVPVTPPIYPTIYTKCVVQGIAPSFPINLKHVVGSLVQGWKEEGEWPPKPPAAVVGEGVGARRERLWEKMRGLKVEGDEVGLEKGVRRGVGKVKRVLGR
ncbi:MAG: hypothetical protein Q9219_003609 [cf. Caloplaca sp. 3 TL-2023]